MKEARQPWQPDGFGKRVFSLFLPSLPNKCNFQLKVTQKQRNPGQPDRPGPIADGQSTPPRFAHKEGLGLQCIKAMGCLWVDPGGRPGKMIAKESTLKLNRQHRCDKTKFSITPHDVIALNKPPSGGSTIDEDAFDFKMTGFVTDKARESAHSQLVQPRNNEKQNKQWFLYS